MTDADRYRLLFGPYRAPRWRYGRVVMDEARGEVTVVGLSAGRIPWPVGQRGRTKAPILAGDLARAVRAEAGVAVAYWWGLAAGPAVDDGRAGVGGDGGRPGRGPDRPAGQCGAGEAVGPPPPHVP